MLAQAERLREDLGAYAGGLAGQVRVLSNTNALTEFLPETLSAFLTAHPNVSVDLEERLSDEIVGLIAEGVADIGIVAGTVDPGRAGDLSVSQRPLRAGGRARSSARATRRRSASPKCWSTISSGSIARARCSASSPTRRRAPGRSLRLRIQLRSFDGVCRLVERNVGVGIVPETTARWAAQTMAIKARAAHRPVGAARSCRSACATTRRCRPMRGSWWITCARRDGRRREALSVRSSPRKRGPSSWPWMPACAGMSGSVVTAASAPSSRDRGSRRDRPPRRP